MSAARVHSMYGDTERTINLKRPIPVYITYQTAFVDNTGKLQARRDVYGLDTTISRILSAERALADVPVARNYNSSSKPVKDADAGKRRSASTNISSRNSSRRSSSETDAFGGNYYANWRTPF